MEQVYPLAKQFKIKYPFCICWRMKRHARIVEQYLNPGEKVIYAFCGQRNDNPLDIVTSCVVALTNKRILVGQKRLLWGHFYYAITPDMFNDMEVRSGILWGKVMIDTVKELMVISNLQKKALDEIETKVTAYMMEEKKKYGGRKPHTHNC